MKRRRDMKLAPVKPSRSDGESGTKRQSVAAATRSAPKKTAPAKLAPETKSPDALQRDLAAADAKIRDLENRLALATDRIAWIADRLHSILDAPK